MDHSVTARLSKIKVRAELLHADLIRLIDSMEDKAFARTPQGEAWLQMAKVSADAAAAFLALNLENIPTGSDDALLDFASAQCDYLESQVPRARKASEKRRLSEKLVQQE